MDTNICSKKILAWNDTYHCQDNGYFKGGREGRNGIK